VAVFLNGGVSKRRVINSSTLNTPDPRHAISRKMKQYNTEGLLERVTRMFSTEGNSAA